MVCPLTNSLDISSAFPQWRSAEDHLWQLLKYIQYLMSDALDSLQLNAGDTMWLNKTAAETLHRDPEAFAHKAKQCVETSKMRVYDSNLSSTASDDPHYIRFDEYSEDIHNSTKQCIREGRTLSLGQNTGVTSSKGLSWVKEGSLSAFSAE